MNDEKTELIAAGKRVELFCGARSRLPLVLYHSVQGEGGSLWKACESLGCPPFCLAVINDVIWNSEMSPWAIPPISAKDEGCTGGADEYLPKLTDEILPSVCEALPSPPAGLALAGYSITALFAVYAAYRTELFYGIVSASGSLWYPGFTDFVKANRMRERTKAVYFSLGDKESRTKNQLLSTVETNTIEIERCISSQGLEKVYERRTGNHF